MLSISLSITHPHAAMLEVFEVDFDEQLCLRLERSAFCWIQSSRYFPQLVDINYTMINGYFLIRCEFINKAF
jgi:hypothetical protein